MLKNKQIPKVRDQYIKNPLSEIIHQTADKGQFVKEDRFIHDKLNIKDMDYTQANTYGLQKKFKGRPTMQTEDIDRTKPKILKQNRITNIPDYKIDVHDIDKPTMNKFKSGRETNPLAPIYKIETQSRRHVVALGEIDGNHPKL